ncbi:protein-L-isoaspartate O-methyltransferase domain-containing protein 1 [Parasteatoda tepidariorum]|uniref:protein-L-isoaspartate O-methyltransferase domain-containing protein 1 n=1 Tax=Parasteatoda tepidariorum TaxID=114398 RepID=UPI00077FCF87|nr:protein-L-isoaspartate O-methyltransferase domain-containing protein 1 [Parasteatoda tepidariorum]XP_015912422.1 protein-L-isoaspartate O-methyltransferase domain-containing protein 1 [Parasteatoda tepidariorum]XP_015912423.1 protein-L-isoaspartate O-methyltransferase domain-containing protein 1 [Parasteatoda tepidariorum]XP_042898954.1 protein-L-isoaspartate O-methyltransferase domain-containing protein 1 [Parasteatoda tepidariorum]
MGGAVSAGEDNDELIDNLVNGEYIKTYVIEKAFRAVDRGKYFLEECRENAYRDLAWKNGNIHLSAPCIYSEVMESLKLGPGLSFLNLGSGTGYLSTMAGLLLGPYGTNHGVELHQSNVEYARNILDEFQSYSPALDKYDFCPPSFVVGNCLLLDSSAPQYDRVYCGASCPTEHENFIKNLVRVGGILVMPINDSLMQIVRTSETTFDVRNVLPVSFASLVVPTVDDGILTSVKLPEKSPLLLQEICRTAIRVILRQTVEVENPFLTEKRVIKKSKHKKNRRFFRRIVIPFIEEARAETPEPPAVDRREEDLASNDEDIQVAGTSEDKNAEEVDSDNSAHANNPGTQKIFLEFDYQDCNPELADAGNDKNEEVDVEMRQEENGECSSACKSGRRRTLTANGDSGIDNISDDSLPEECVSDSDKFEDDESPDPTAERNSDGRPGNSSYLKRSAEENAEEDLAVISDNVAPRRRYPHCRGSSVIFKRVAFSDPDSDELEEIDSDSDTNENLPRYDEKSYLSRYTHFLKQKINQLPIPHPLKIYLNLSRPV